MRRAVWLLVLFAGCRCEKKKEPPPLEHVTELVVVDASAPDAFEAGPPREWVRFHGPPFKDETPMHGGPDWSFETDLPAIDGAGNIAIPLDVTNDLSNVPNFAVEVRGPDGHITSTTWLLQVSEFDKALESPSRQTSFKALAPIVEKRVADENVVLSAAGFVPLEPCTIAPAPYDSFPPCSMASQKITCNAIAITYAKQTLDFAGAKKPFPTWKRPSMKTEYGPMPIGECFGAAWIEPTRKLFVGELDYECQGGGDWCTVDPEWKVVPW